MFKTKLLLVFLFVGASLTSFAQIQGVFAVKVGPSSSKTLIDGDSPYISKFKTAFHLGALYRLRYHRVVLQPEVLYSLKGGTFKESTGITRNNYNYLSVPVLLGWVPTEGLVLQAGPEFSYALNTPTSGGPGQRYDTGIAVGAHYDFLDLLEKCSLHLRYIYGLNNVSNVAGTNYYNRTVQVSLVYNFYKKK